MDLGACLHDGILEAVCSDIVAHRLTLVINSPFHWEFHHLPCETRFKIVGDEASPEGVSSWDEFVSKVGNGDEHVIISADIASEGRTSVLKLGILSPDSDWSDMELRASTFRFYVDQRELSLEEFGEFGKAYWDDWSKRHASNIEDKKVK